MDRYNPEDVRRIRDRIETWNYEQRFPGAQPVSFGFENLKMIQTTKTIVCEKTDGFRFLLVEVLLG